MAVAKVVLRLIVYAFLILLAVAAGTLSYLHFADLDQYRDQIAGAVTAITDREFSLSHLDVDLWPEVSVTVDNVILANPSWASEPDMARIGHFSISVAPVSLMIGPAVVKHLELKDVSLEMEDDRDGSSNWNFSTSSEHVGAGSREFEGRRGDGFPIVVENARVSNAVINRRQSGSSEQQYRVDDLVIQSDNVGQLDLAVTGKMLEFPLELNGRIAARSGSDESDKGDISVSGSLGDIRLKVSGNLGNQDDRQDARIEVLVHCDDIAGFIQKAGLSVPLSGPLEIKSNIVSDGKDFNVTTQSSLGAFSMTASLDKEHEQIGIDGVLNGVDKLGAMLGIAGLTGEPVSINGNLGSSDQTVKVQNINLATGTVQLTAEGEIETGDRTASLQIKAHGGSLAELMTFLPPLGFDGTTDLLIAPDEIEADRFKLRVGNSDIGGKLHISTSNKTSIKAELASSTVNVTELTGEIEELDTDQETIETRAPETVTSSDGDYVFSDDPLPFGHLAVVDAEVVMTVETLVTPQADLHELKVQADLHGGILQSDVSFKSVSGGLVSGKTTLDASSRQPGLEASWYARKLRLKLISSDLAELQETPAINITADLQSNGSSLHALAGNSGGSVLVTLESGLIDNTILNKISSDIVSQIISTLNPFTKKIPYTKLQCGIVSIHIVDGLSTVNPLMMQDNNILILAGGTIDLKTEKLDIEFNTKPRTGVGVSADMFVSPFIGIQGTLAKPKVGLRTKSTLLTLGAAFATGGLSLALTGGMDRVTGGFDQCKVMMPEYSHPPLAAETLKD